jgi:hypothetical protein
MGQKGRDDALPPLVIQVRVRRFEFKGSQFTLHRSEFNLQVAGFVAMIRAFRFF